MTPWQWWAVPECCRSDGEWSIGECDTREQIIAAANRELPPETPFFIIEARSSTDARYYDGNHELVPFKRTRNEERLVTGMRAVA